MVTDHTTRQAPPEAGGPLTQVAERPQFYRPVHDWLNARPGRRVAEVAYLLIAIQTAWRLWLAMKGWFVGDDFAFIGRAYEYPLLSHKYLFLAYANHFMPGAFVQVWLWSHAAPYNFVVPTLVDAVLQLATAVVVYRILTALFGRRWVIIAPLAMFLCTTITVPAFVWWAAALNQAPQQLAFASALLCQIRYLQTGSQRRGLAGVLCILGGLAFSEKTLLCVPFILVFTVLFFVEGPPLSRPWRLLRRMPLVTSAYLFVAASYAVFYVLVVPSPTHAGTTSSGFVSLARLQMFYAYIPGLFGGPWHWQPLGTNAALADPPLPAVLACAVAMACIVYVSIKLAHRSVFGWFLLLGYMSANVVLLGLSRAAIVGPNLGLEYRYITDLGLVSTICISLALIPLSADCGIGVPQRLVPRPEAADAVARWRSSQLAEALPSVRGTSVLAVVTLLLIASGVWSSSRYVKIFSPNYARPIIVGAQKHAPKLPPDAVVSDTPLASAAIWALVFPYTIPSRALRPLDLKLSYLHVGQATDRLVVLDDDGNFRRAAINGLVANPGPAINCGWRVDAEPVAITLPNATLVPWTWVVRIGYIATADATTVVTAGSKSVPIAVHRGLGEVFVMVEGMVTSVRLGGLSDGAGLCTNDVQVGTAVPIPGSTP